MLARAGPRSPASAVRAARPTSSGRVLRLSSSSTTVSGITSAASPNDRETVRIGDQHRRVDDHPGADWSRRRLRARSRCARRRSREDRSRSPLTSVVDQENLVGGGQSQQRRIVVPHVVSRPWWMHGATCISSGRAMPRGMRVLRCRRRACRRAHEVLARRRRRGVPRPVAAVPRPHAWSCRAPCRDARRPRAATRSVRTSNACGRSRPRCRARSMPAARSSPTTTSSVRASPTFTCTSCRARAATVCAASSGRVSDTRRAKRTRTPSDLRRAR